MMPLIKYDFFAKRSQGQVSVCRKIVERKVGTEVQCNVLPSLHPLERCEQVLVAISNLD